MNWYQKIKSSRYFYDFILFTVAVGLYSPSLMNGFVGDDFIYFIGNHHISTFDVRTILLHGAIGSDYCPLRDLSFALDYLAWGENPFGFHLTNLVLFGGTAVAVKHLISRISVLLEDRGEQGEESPIPEMQAFLAALLFAIHPVQQEVVYAVYNRGALLTNLFFILSCVAFIRFLRSGQSRICTYITAFFWCICTFMSREYGIILPLVLVLLAAFHEPSRRVSTFFRTIPFFIAAAVFYFVFQQYAVDAAYIAPTTAPSLSDVLSKIAVAAKIVLYYPLRLTSFEIPVSRNIDFVSNLITVVAVLLVAGALFAAYAVRRQHPRLMFFLLFYLVCLVPVLNFFNTEPIVADRYAYLPGLGLFCAITAIPFLGWRKYIPIACIALTIFLVVVTQRFLFYWKDDISYWGQMVAKYRSSIAYGRLGSALFRENRIIEAEEALVMARIFSTGAVDDVTTGDRYKQHEYYEQAIQAYNSALAKMAAKKTVPSPEQAVLANKGVAMDILYSNLASSYFNSGDHENALRYFEQAVKLKPRQATLHNSIGAIYALTGNYHAARQKFEQAAVLDSGYGPAFLNLVKIYRIMGDEPKEKEYSEILRVRFPHLFKE